MRHNRRYVRTIRSSTQSSKCVAGIALFLLFAVTSGALGQEASDSIHVAASAAGQASGNAAVKDSVVMTAEETQERRTAANEQSLSLELSGLIVDETQTKIGRDFYEYFYAMWQAPRGAGDFTITITERPMPRHGTQIKVVVNDYEVMQNFLQPRGDVIEETALYAVQRAYGFLQNYQSIMEQLQGDDMAGSGIF